MDKETFLALRHKDSVPLAIAEELVQAAKRGEVPSMCHMGCKLGRS